MKTVFEKTEWFRKAEYGLFFHFLNSGSALHPPENRSQRIPAPPDEWNRMVDSFDADAIAKQVHELGAGYAFLTVGQNSGYYCAPNETYDRIMGLSGDRSKCSRRDLISDFADALAKYNIPLLAYTTTLAPGFDFDAVRNLKSIPPWNCNANCGNYQEVKQFAGTDPRLREFQTMWSAIHAEWMRRWGTKVKGWWVDGSYFADKMYAFPDPPNGKSFADALRTGNPDAIIAFNPGVVYPPRAVDPCQDYLAGEINEPEYGLLNGPMVEGMQYHVLTYVGQYWGKGPVRGDGKTLAAMTRNITDNGGVVSWDLPFSPKGIDDELFAVLKEFADQYARSKKLFPKTEVKITPPCWNAEGKGIPGKVELHSVDPAEIELEWNGSLCTNGGEKDAVIELAPADAKECRLKLSCGGFSREIPVHIAREIALSSSLSAPMELKTKDGVRHLGAYQCAVADGDFIIDAEIFEQKPEIRAMPWECSCLEVFLSDGVQEKVQICIRHDGAVFQVKNGAVEEYPAVKIVPGRRDADSFRFRAEIPLSLMKSYRPEDKTFFFDFQQSVKEGNAVLRNMLSGFAGGIVSEFAKAIVK